MKRILFIVPHRLGRSPGQRFRFEQYTDFIKENGYECVISNIISQKDDTLFYSKGKLLQKFRILLKSFKIRYRDLKRVKDFDIIFIYREAFMLGSAFFERKISKKNKKIIFDFDDAIWLKEVSDGNKYLAWLKYPSKTAAIIKLSALVIAGNEYLAGYAAIYNKNVRVFPTTLNTALFSPALKEKTGNRICIGWTGSSTTLKHLKLLISSLRKIKDTYKEKVYFKVISDIPIRSDVIEIINCKWNLLSELQDLSEIDIGIMPLPDDEWSKGKCGFKGLQYMSLEIPTVMSPVGVNTEIIQDGFNGFLAGNDAEWIEKLSLLIDSPELREKLGKEGRKTVVEKYSFESQKQKYLQYFNELVDKAD